MDRPAAAAARRARRKSGDGELKPGYLNQPLVVITIYVHNALLTFFFVVLPKTILRIDHPLHSPPSSLTT
jgi:hypothetical protein